MSEPNVYEIEIRGRVDERVLHPVIDDFSIEPATSGATRLVGEIRDPSHLNGILAHFTSLNIEVVYLWRIDNEAAPANPDPVHLTHNQQICHCQQISHQQQKGT